MKNLIWALVAVLIAGGIFMTHRYSLVLHSPIVARIDNYTGKVWIVNSGVWYQVQDSAQGNAAPEQKPIIPVSKKGK